MIQRSRRRQVSPASANGYLLERVEPQYPEAAQQQHIQGPVELKVLVGTDGLVRKLTMISGDPLLAKAPRRTRCGNGVSSLTNSMARWLSSRPGSR